MTPSTATPFAPIHLAPDPAATRLLTGWYETGRPATLTDHLRRYGPPPVDRTLGGRGIPPLVDIVEAAGLTGRGGAGFPAATKLRAVTERRGRAVVVVNAMESEPASCKDQFLLGVAPHLVLDGAVLAATAVGADTVHVCVPRTRTTQYRRVAEALDQRRRARLDRVRLLPHALPHAYVSSESTSLVRWLNGGPARPQGNRPRTHERGVGKRPTLVHNAETLAHLALITRYGSDWFRQTGTRDEPGTMLVTVSDANTVPAVFEIRIGTTLSAILDLAGHSWEPKPTILIGGFAGTWLPAECGHTPLSRCSLAEVNAAPGAGVLVALPRAACGLSETARMLTYLVLQRHSCSGEWVAAASVMGESGLVLSASSESGPGPDMVGPVVTGADEGDEQAADLG
ncbi:NADH-quinone oxidoreductase subunit F [Nocardia seriolae]|uniref:NADH-quinone oxidoreductase subunit F n=1 Tax=Nocardia seriolae TaxID=37332 RepID=UPI002E2F2490|nr:NADH-quinone oxidoreductase subunit F [Nocardia seriolae]